MIPWLRRQLDNFIGSGDAALAVPPMDGSLKPNRMLDSCDLALEVPAPDDLCLAGDRLVVSSGSDLHDVALADGAPRSQLRSRYESGIAAIAARGASLAVALSNGSIVIEGGPFGGRTYGLPLDGRPPCLTAIAFLDDDRLLVCVGSARYPLEEWQSDLLTRGNSGSVWKLDLGTGEAGRLADGLGFPYGIARTADGQGVLVSESWKHRLLRLRPGSSAAPEVVLDDLPAYPARLHGDGADGFWLALFAPRNQLVEFVIREREYRDRMMAALPRDQWIAPTVRSRGSFLEPLQGGGVRQMGMLKPWAPTRSYGLVIRLDGALVPRLSMHSRADGKRHGTTSCVPLDGRLVVASKGAGELLFCNVGSR